MFPVSIDSPCCLSSTLYQVTSQTGTVNKPVMSAHMQKMAAEQHLTYMMPSLYTYMYVHTCSSCSAAWVLQLLCWKYSIPVLRNVCNIQDTLIQTCCLATSQIRTCFLFLHVQTLAFFFYLPAANRSRSSFLHLNYRCNKIIC